MSDGTTCEFPGCSNPARGPHGLCNGHRLQKQAGRPLKRLRPVGRSAEERFFWYVAQQGDCWIWDGLRGAGGYGRFVVRPGVECYAHRWCYEFLRTEIPGGLHLDHLCCNPPCVNPWHLEPVTPSVNAQRVALNGNNHWTNRTRCSRGHAYSAENTYYPPRGGRVCRACKRERYAKP